MSEDHKDMLTIFIVDAFTKVPFKGNPAAVCLVPHNKNVSKCTMQKIAAEMNLSETAFISILEEKDTFKNGKRFGLRWFTPKREVPLCGHATLASAAALFSACGNDSPILEFETMSGILTAKKMPDSKVEIDLPVIKYKPVELIKYEGIIKASVGSLAVVQEVVLSDSGKLLVRLRDDATRSQLEALEPEQAEMLHAESDLFGVIITLIAKDGEHDFFSRFFAPWAGVYEDPVCGSAHCVLTPYWSKVLGKTKLSAHQCSPRGGELNLNLKEDRVAISGHSVLVLQGHISF